MLSLLNITLRNFLSIGAVTQALKLDQHGLTLVLGENTDIGGRNGVGKSSLIQAISYALFGKPLTQIKVDNLINSINQKNMLVTIEFERDGKKFRVERGRKPNVLRYFVNDGLVENPDGDEAQGENRKTQEDIEKVIGFSHMIFRHIVALNTFSEPFLRMKAADQRSTIEELLGVTQISSKADTLKELIKETKDAVKEEEFRIKAIMESNSRIQNSINDLALRSRQWEAEQERKCRTLAEQLTALLTLDIEAEIEGHRQAATTRTIQANYLSLKIASRTATEQHDKLTRSLERIANELKVVIDDTCPTCGQKIHHDRHLAIVAEAEQERNRLLAEIKQSDETLNNAKTDAELVQIELQRRGEAPSLHYADIEKALEHRHTLLRLQETALSAADASNPYQNQIDMLHHDGIQPVVYDLVNQLNNVLRHQEFLLKLLVSKDSFIRRKIIDKNISFLNHCLGFYLEKLGLPHEVRFVSDLSVEIALLGRDFDFEQLSRGEMNRIILATSWSFRDVWQSLNNPINVLFIDESLDQGTDNNGVEAAISVLKNLARDRNMSIFVITHKDEFIEQFDTVLYVKKENSFTRLDMSL